MTKSEKIALVLLRVTIGWMMLYAGLTKIFNPEWTAEGYLKGAKAFAWFFSTLTNPSVLPLVNFVNEWGLTLLGISLILGIAVRLSSLLGIVLMLLYYFANPDLNFPYLPHSFIVDEHIIYAAALYLLASYRAGKVWGLENRCASLPICSKYPKLRAWIG